MGAVGLEEPETPIELAGLDRAEKGVDQLTQLQRLVRRR
jgi:hypothetical protein